MRYYTKERAEHYARVAERNRKMTIHLGKVSCDLHDRASRVRVQIEGTHGTPLSVKASLNNYPRSLFKKGVAVEVEQSRCDGRKFRVTQVFEPVRKSVHLQFNVPVPDAEAFRARVYREDRAVRFWISSRYANDPTMADVMCRVLVSAMGMKENEVNALMTVDIRGFWVICRESQFARFLIMRNEEGLPNLFQDLRADYYTPGDSRPEIDVSNR